MTQEEIVAKLRASFGDAIGAWRESQGENAYQRRMGAQLAIIDPKALIEIAFFLRDDKEFDINNLLLISSVDNGDGSLSIVYQFESTRKHHQIALRVTVPREHAMVPTITPVFAHANWHEREAWDMMAIRFIGHPDHRRILLEDDYPGHPMLKDFREPDFYHGMKVPND